MDGERVKKGNGGGKGTRGRVKDEGVKERKMGRGEGEKDGEG